MTAATLRTDRPVATLRQLRRLRWAVRATLMLGVAASIAANILHAPNSPIAQAIAAWPPLALLVTIEVIARVPVYRRSLAIVRLLATTTIGAIAAYVSYYHMAAVAARYGEAGINPYLLPLSVDGIVVVASVSLVELAGRIRAAQGPTPPAVEASPTPTPTVTAPSSAHRADRSGCGGGSTAALHPLSDAGTDTILARANVLQPPAAGGELQPITNDKKTLISADTGTSPASREDTATDEAAEPTLSNLSTRDAVAYLLALDPTLGVDTIAEKLGRHPRTVRRYLPDDNTQQAPNPHRSELTTGLNGHTPTTPDRDETPDH